MENRDIKNKAEELDEEELDKVSGGVSQFVPTGKFSGSTAKDQFDKKLDRSGTVGTTTPTPTTPGSTLKR